MSVRLHVVRIHFLVQLYELVRGEMARVVDTYQEKVLAGDELEAVTYALKSLMHGRALGEKFFANAPDGRRVSANHDLDKKNVYGIEIQERAGILLAWWPECWASSLQPEEDFLVDHVEAVLATNVAHVVHNGVMHEFTYGPHNQLVDLLVVAREHFLPLAPDKEKTNLYRWDTGQAAASGPVCDVPAEAWPLTLRWPL